VTLNITTKNFIPKGWSRRKCCLKNFIESIYSPFSIKTASAYAVINFQENSAFSRLFWTCSRTHE